MNGARALSGLALLTAILYSGVAWLWYVELLPGAGGLQPFVAMLLVWMIVWPIRGMWRGLEVLPLLYLGADLLENARVAHILTQEVVLPEAVLAASQAMIAKFGFLIVSVIALGAVSVTTRLP